MELVRENTEYAAAEAGSPKGQWQAALKGIRSIGSGCRVVSVGVACLLWVASGLKFWQLTHEPILETSWLDSRWLLMATVEAEILLGLILLANVWAKPTWAVVLVCFGTFSCMSLYKWVAGHQSCGCFGAYQVNPWYTCACDLLVIASLLRWRPKHSSFSIRRAMAVMVVWAMVGIPAGYAMVSYTDTTLADAGTISGDGKIVVSSC